MIPSFLYFILALLGLGFLVFIHELGHYFVARRVGMRVEAFAIGFGKPIYSWDRKGVKWQIGILPFGGFVKIAGMQKENGVDPYKIPDGFFGKKPLDRIKVAVMGPVVNIVFAFLAFGAIWAMGGREKSFGEFTHKIGWVEENSPLYEYGVRPGDEVTSYDGREVRSFKDILYASILNDSKTSISGNKVDYFRDKRTPFTYNMQNYEDYASPIHARTIGLAGPASYLIYNRFQDKSENPLPAWSPLKESGIQYGDRIFWVDGEIVFSMPHLKSLISSHTAFLTIERGGRILHSKVPRVKVEELKLSALEKAELDDWQHEIGIKDNLQDLYFLPFLISSENLVNRRLDFLDEDMQKKTFLTCTRCAFFQPLKSGDKIIAVDGFPVANSFELLKKLQTKTATIIVQRDSSFLKPISWKEEDSAFNQAILPSDINTIVDSLGTGHPVRSAGNLVLLKSITPLRFEDLPDSQQKAHFIKQMQERRKEIEKINDSEKRSLALKALDKEFHQDYLGISLQDRMVNYNPSPFQEFSSIFKETWRTFFALISGYLSPKWLSGPIGIVHAVQRSWFYGAKEALFWMGVVSLNLGILNLLPIPVLDGGHIVFSLFEACTRRKIQPKTMERLVLPFVILIIGFFIYVTYHDITRLFSRFF